MPTQEAKILVCMDGSGGIILSQVTLCRVWPKVNGHLYAMPGTNPIKMTH